MQVCFFSFIEQIFKQKHYIFRRHRNQEKPTNYIVDAASVKANETGLQATLKSEINNLKLELVLLKDNVVRILLDEAGTPLRSRFQPLIALNGTPVHER